jgi:hypothetical protein
LAIIMASPITVMVAGNLVHEPGALLLAGPTLLGLVAAPGYVYALGRWRHLSSYRAGVRWWVRASFVVALGASLLGAAVGLAFSAPAPSSAAVLTAIVVVVAWRRLESRADVAHERRHDPRGAD